MSGEKEIRTQIASIGNTQKITKAMEMVAASKMRRAQDRMAASRPYAERIRQAIGHVAGAQHEYRHPYLVARDEVKGAGFIIVSTDRGLCGGLNINLFKAAFGAIKEWQDKGAKVRVTVIGNKALGFFRRYAEIVSQATHLGDTPHIEQLIGPVKPMLDAYTDGEIDRLFLVENQFVNTMTQKPRVSQLIPTTGVEEDAAAAGRMWDYIYEPEARAVLDTMLRRYIESQIYQAVVENVACEMAARMVAMKSASENAGELIGQLQLAYNKARQAAITQEISEIVGGAAAV